MTICLISRAKDYILLILKYRNIIIKLEIGIDKVLETGSKILLILEA